MIAQSLHRASGRSSEKTGGEFVAELRRHQDNPPTRRLPRFEDEVDKNHIQVSVYGLRFCNAYHFIYHYGYHYPMRAGQNW